MVETLALAQITYVLGFSNILFGLLVLFSCRCMLGNAVGRLYKYEWYKRFYSFHCYYWWFFIISVFLHAIIALTAFGNPF